jgi:hypothetical protein
MTERLRSKQTQDYDGSCLHLEVALNPPRLHRSLCLLRVSQQRQQLETWERAQLGWIWSGHHGRHALYAAWVIWFPQRNNAQGNIYSTSIHLNLRNFTTLSLREQNGSLKLGKDNKLKNDAIHIQHLHDVAKSCSGLLHQEGTNLHSFWYTSVHTIVGYKRFGQVPSASLIQLQLSFSFRTSPQGKGSRFKNVSHRDGLLGQFRVGMWTRLAPCGPSRGCRQLVDEALGRLLRLPVLTSRTRVA